MNRVGWIWRSTFVVGTKIERKREREKDGTDECFYSAGVLDIGRLLCRSRLSKKEEMRE